MSGDAQHLRIEQRDGISLVYVTESWLTDEITVSQIGEQLASLVSADKPRILIDLSTVEHIGSAMLGQLLRLHRQIDANGGALGICSVARTPMEAFHATRLLNVFKIYRDEDEAISKMTPGT